MAVEAARDDRGLAARGRSGGSTVPTASDSGLTRTSTSPCRPLRCEKLAQLAARPCRSPAVPGQHLDLAQEAGHPAVGRARVDLLGGADLLDPPLVHHGDDVGDAQRLLLVVGDEDGGDALRREDLARLLAHLLAQARVEVGERLVEQDRARLGDQGPRQGDALLLAAGELVRVTAAEPRQPDGREHRLDPVERRGGGRGRSRRCRRRRGGGRGRSPGRPCRSAAARPAASAAAVETVSPPISTLPASGSSSPAISRRVVVLPQPLGPSRAQVAPGSISRSTPSTAMTSPNDLRRPRRRSEAPRDLMLLSEPASMAENLRLGEPNPPPPTRRQMNLFQHSPSPPCSPPDRRRAGLRRLRLRHHRLQRERRRAGDRGDNPLLRPHPGGDRRGRRRL